MSKPENKKPWLQFKQTELAFYADTSGHGIQNWLYRGIFEVLPSDQIYLSTGPSDNRNVVRNLLSSRARAIIMIGDDACFERFINLYREMNPNPSRTHYLGFVPLGQSHFATRFGLSLSAAKLSRIESMRFASCMLSFPEFHSQLALQLGVGRLLSSIRYVPTSLRRQLMHTPLARPLPGMYAMTCVNEAPEAYATSHEGMILHTLYQDQILFNQRVMTMRIDPSRLSLPGRPETQSHFFELRVRTLATSGQFIFPIRHQTESYLCQRVKLEFAQPVTLHTCSSRQETSSVSVTLCGRTYRCLIPLGLSDATTPLD